MKVLLGLAVLLNSFSAFADCSEKAVMEKAADFVKQEVATINAELKSVDSKSGVTLESMKLGGKFYLGRATAVTTYSLRFYGEVNETKDYARIFSFAHSDQCATFTTTTVEMSASL